MSALIEPDLVPARLNRFAELIRDIDTNDLAAALEHAALLLGPPTVRPRSEWSDGDADVLWWHFPVQEAPYCGSPLDADWPEREDGPVPTGYYTHWTPIVVPNPPADWTPPRENQCKKSDWCMDPDGHDGECSDIPF